jgi:hypothetical protein
MVLMARDDDDDFCKVAGSRIGYPSTVPLVGSHSSEGRKLLQLE